MGFRQPLILLTLRPCLSQTRHNRTNQVVNYLSAVNTTPMKSHPLDPLNEKEITKAAKIINDQANLDDSAWFETITLEEPGKDELNNFETGQSIERRAYVCCYEPVSNRTFSGIANIGSERPSIS